MTTLIEQIYSITIEGTNAQPCPNGAIIQTEFFKSEKGADTFAKASLDNGYKVLKLRITLNP